MWHGFWAMQSVRLPDEGIENFDAGLNRLARAGQRRLNSFFWWLPCHISKGSGNLLRSMPFWVWPSAHCGEWDGHPCTIIFHGSFALARKTMLSHVQTHSFKFISLLCWQPMTQGCFEQLVLLGFKSVFLQQWYRETSGPNLWEISDDICQQDSRQCRNRWPVQF